MAAKSLTPVLCHIRQLTEAAALRSLSDRELLDRFAAAKDQAAFEALVRRHGKLVLSACRQVLSDPADVDDAFQATFLTLLLRADSVRWQPSIGNWLFGTAHRIAVQARTSAARRRQREAQAAAVRERSSEPPDLSWREAVGLLHEELDRLPDRHRLPLLLCYLQGKSRDEAAEQLGWTTGSVKGRLERGREELRKRLVRRGITLSAGLLGALGNSSAVGALPPRLVQATLRAATAGDVPAAIAALTGGVSAMLGSKIKLTAALVLCVAMMTGIAAHRAPAPLSASPPGEASRFAYAPAPGKPAPEPPPDSDEDDETITVSGKVLGPDGKPAAGATLLLLGKGDKAVKLGTTAADGRFTVTVPKDRERHSLVARVDGAGIDFVNLGRRDPAGPVRLRAVKDHAIRGRVIDTEGKPVAGVRVEARDLGVYPNNSLDSFLVAWKKRHYMDGLPGGVKHLETRAGALFTTKTDAEGQFVLRGAGDERLVSLRLSGAGIAHTEAWIVNRQGFDPKPYNEASRNNVPKGFEGAGILWLLHGPNPTLIVETGKTIRGVVKDVDTGKPRSGVEVRLTRRNTGDLLSVLLTGKSDAKGRYEIVGARKEKRYMVEVKSDPKNGYMACQVWADDTPAYQPVTINIGTKKGVVITGRVIDRTTGKPVPGFAMAAVLGNNPFAKDYPKFDSSAWMRRQKTAPDGTFRVVAPAGPVLLMGGPDPKQLPDGFLGRLKYKPPVPDPKYPRHFRALGYFNFKGIFSPIQGNFCKVLQIKPGTAVVKQDIVLERASALSVKVQDAKGRPLNGAWVTGISPRNWTRPVRVETDSCSAYHVEAGKPRRMVFFHPARNLAGTVLLKGDEKPPVVVKLGPAATVKGRLVGADGKPLAGVRVDLNYRDREADELHEAVHRTKLVVTDTAGAFTLKGVIPGLKFELTFRRGGRRFEREPKPAAPDLQAKPGERRDLGAIKLRPVAED